MGVTPLFQPAVLQVGVANVLESKMALRAFPWLLLTLYLHVRAKSGVLAVLLMLYAATHAPLPDCRDRTKDLNDDRDIARSLFGSSEKSPSCPKSNGLVYLPTRHLRAFQLLV